HARQNRQQGRLARARGADDGDQLAAFDGEAEALQRLHLDALAREDAHEVGAADVCRGADARGVGHGSSTVRRMAAARARRVIARAARVAPAVTTMKPPTVSSRMSGSIRYAGARSPVVNARRSMTELSRIGSSAPKTPPTTSAATPAGTSSHA